MILNYDLERLKNLLVSFYTLTRMRIVVLGNDLTKIAEYPHSDCAFCSIIRSDPLAEKRCRESDRYACEQCRATNGFYSYTCHAGLVEAVTPIRHGDLVIGYIMFGQVLVSRDKGQYWHEIWRRCSGYQLDTQRLEEAFAQKRATSMEQVFASAQILEACAGYLYLERLISLKEDSLLSQIDEYICANLQDDLSVEALCRRFCVSRSKLYHIMRTEYGKGIEQTTRSLRVGKARELLLNTELSLKEIAAQVGYGDYNYFIKVFRKETGTSPASFRKYRGAPTD